MDARRHPHPLRHHGDVGIASCSKDDDSPIVTPAAKEYFTLWNQCEALTTLQDYVKDVTNL